MTKKKVGARRGRPRKSPSPQPQQENRIQLVPESPEAESLNQSQPENPESSTGSTQPSETSAATDAFEAAVAEVGAELGGEFDAVVDPEAAAQVATGEGEIIPPDDDEDAKLIAEICTVENLRLYCDVPFDLAADLLQKPDIKLRPHERALLLPLVKKYANVLMRSTDEPEWAAFMLFVLIYGGRLGLTEWALPKIQTILGRGTKTADSAA